MSETSRGRGRGTASRRGSFAPRGKGRRSEADRQRLQEEERERNLARDSQYQAQLAEQKRQDERKKRMERGRGDWRGRGRGGGFMGDRLAASGPLSAGSVIPGIIKPGKAFPRPYEGTGKRGGDQFSGPSKEQDSSVWKEPTIKREGASTSRGVNFDSTEFDWEDGGYISSDPDEGLQGPRRDINKIDVIDVDEEDSKSMPSLLPVRLIQRQHQDRAVQINAEARKSTVKSKNIKSKPAAKKPGATTSQQSTPKPSAQKPQPSQQWAGAWSDSDGEEDVIQPVIDDDSPPTAMTAQPPARLDSTAHVDPDLKVILRQPQQVFQTEEDRLEYERRKRKLAILRTELAAPPGESHSKPDATVAEKQADDRVYLFQFPPSLPDLHAKKSLVKEEPQSPELTAHALPLINGSNEEQAIKVEENVKEQKKKVQIAPIRNAHLPSMESGQAGKLRIHRDGTVTLTWAGSVLKTSMGLETSCIQDYVMIKASEERLGQNSGKEVPRGSSLAFGQARGKYVVTPDWDQLLLEGLG